MLNGAPKVGTTTTAMLTFVHRPMLQLIALHSDIRSFRPNVGDVKFSPFFQCVLLYAFLFYAVLLIVSAFSFFGLPILLLGVLASTSVAVVYVLYTRTVEEGG